MESGSVERLGLVEKVQLAGYNGFGEEDYYYLPVGFIDIDDAKRVDGTCYHTIPLDIYEGHLKLLKEASVGEMLDWDKFPGQFVPTNMGTNLFMFMDEKLGPFVNTVHWPRPVPLGAITSPLKNRCMQ